MLAGEARVDERRAHAVAHLGRNHGVLAPGPQRPSEHAFGLALRIDIGRVEEVDAAVEGPPDQRVGTGLVHLVDRGEAARRRAERHAAEGQTRNHQARVADHIDGFSDIGADRNDA